MCRTSRSRYISMSLAVQKHVIRDIFQIIALRLPAIKNSSASGSADCDSQHLLRRVVRLVARTLGWTTERRVKKNIQLESVDEGDADLERNGDGEVNLNIRNSDLVDVFFCSCFAIGGCLIRL